MARLVWKQQNGEEKTFSLGPSCVLGREPSADCVFPRRSVSSWHAHIKRTRKGYCILDLDSRNGTCVNGKPVAHETVLRAGDVIRLGGETLEFDPEVGADTGFSSWLLNVTNLLTGPTSDWKVSISRLLRDAKDRLSGSEKETLPRRQGKFLLLEELGRGGMGVVYHGVDLTSNQRIAVKFFRSALGQLEAFLDFFHRREAVIAREISHPNIIQIYEHGLADGRQYIAMEYIAGDDLHQIMRRRRLGAAEILEVIRQIACGLAAAHRLGVVHSDIKPANIMIIRDHPSRSRSDDELTDYLFTREDTTDPLLEFNPALEDPDDGETDALPHDSSDVERRRYVTERELRELLATPPYFQRVVETRFLDYYFDRTLTGRGCFILVEGESGAGKDRLVSQFLTARERETRSLNTEDWPRFYVLDARGKSGLADLYEQVIGLPLQDARDLNALEEDLVDAFTRASFPYVVRVRHLETAGPETCQLLTRLAPLLARKRAFLLATLDADRTHRIVRVRKLLETLAPHTKELYVHPLTEYEIQTYLQSCLGPDSAGPSLAKDLHRLAGGNFRRTLELLGSFLDAGVLRPSNGCGRLTYRPRPRGFELEEGKDLYGRYRSLGRTERELIERAAFLGPRFPLDVLLSLHDGDETALLFAVRTLTLDGFFVEEDRGWYRFTNYSFQDYIAETTPPDQRPALHRKVSWLLHEGSRPASPELLLLRAHHLRGSQQYTKAVRALLEGAHMAGSEYKEELRCRLYQEILHIYRFLFDDDARRRDVVAVLEEWFRVRHANWYRILSDRCTQKLEATVRIADFGISFRVADQNRGYSVGRQPRMGTPQYLSPEKARGESGDSKSDIFSLGVIAYELVVGEPPFPGLKGADLVRANRDRRITCPPGSLSQYPPGMEEMLMGMLEPDPRLRWDAERILRATVQMEFDAQGR